MSHMPLPPLVPDNAPFSPSQRAWLNGFFAGILNLDQMAGGMGAQPFINGEALSNGAQALAGGAPVAAPVDDDDDFPWHDPALPIDERLALADDRPFSRKLMSAMGQLDCGQCGYDCKTYAEALSTGGEKKLNLCQPGGRETRRTLERLIADAQGLANGAAAPAATPAEVAPNPGVGRDHPVAAKFRSADRLTAEESAKDVRHVVIDLSESGLTYRPGDALGLYADNDPALADSVIAALGAEPDAEVGDGNGHSRTLRQALLTERDLRRPTSDLFRLLADVATDLDEAAKLVRLAADDDPDGDLDELDVLDVLLRFGSARLPAKAFVEALEPLQPRLYSIASSAMAHPGEVHLTVGVQREEKRGRKRNGVASTFLAERLNPELGLKVYIQAAHGFALPEDNKRPIIMIGPGTGIAPFRSFLEERKVRKAEGKSWLFFGNPYRSTDYLYEKELETFRQEGVLSRLDVAFSRDGAQKLYVQDLMRREGPELWRWLQEGAHVYVCGDAKRMAADVDKALTAVVAAEGGMDEKAAKAWVKDLAKTGRYQRDVY